MSDDESSSDETEQKNEGYCHFNDNGSNTNFSISLFGNNLSIVQNPASRSLGHGAVVWDAAVIFAKYMECSPKEFNATKLSGSKVLELGSGCGLAGIAFMMASVFRFEYMRLFNIALWLQKGAAVTFTDLPQVINELTSYNAQKTYRQLVTSGGGGATLLPPKILPIDWTSFTPSVFRTDIVEVATELHHPPFDIILLTDCVFSVSLVQPLINTILACCDTKSEIICCHEIRDEEANAYFVSEFKKHFVVKRIPRTKLNHEYRNNLVEVLSARLIRGKKKASAPHSAEDATLSEEHA